MSYVTSVRVIIIEHKKKPLKVCNTREWNAVLSIDFLQLHFGWSQCINDEEWMGKFELHSIFCEIIIGIILESCHGAQHMKDETLSWIGHLHFA